ncbi:MAG: hypothetical protein ACI4OY_12920 [Aristaeellaceae bacterium]
MIRTACYKLVVTGEELAPQLLFDMLQDPGEERNLLLDGQDWRQVTEPMLQALAGAIG